MPSDLLILIESRVFLWWILVSMFRCAGALCFVSVLQIGRRTLAAGGARHTSTRQQRAAPVGAAGQAAPQARSRPAAPAAAGLCVEGSRALLGSPARRLGPWRRWAAATQLGRAAPVACDPGAAVLVSAQGASQPATASSSTLRRRY